MVGDHMTKAIIFLPPGQPYDGTYAKQCLVHIERRAYLLHSIVNQWDAALSMVRAGFAHVIVFARLDHLSNEWEPRIEFVGDETVELTRAAAAIKPRNERHEPGDTRTRRPRPAL